ncbi:cation:proton antiporter [Nocardioides panacisoli]|uniref:cation:proton antiporter n=1 Tax=Nocardioides panacisoli TaxID=627624 RepID=UPI001C63876E|nr:cation:proton antiporter [Nocardioides panacisoli]QYJ04799.1 cation:proton antiporter [Nocardioides panacisoli]
MLDALAASSVLDDLAGLGPAPYLALVVVLAASAQTIAWRLGVPSILLLLVVGFGLGQVVGPESVLGRDVLFDGVTIAVGIILFEGSLSLHWRDLRDLGRPVLRLCTVTVAIAWTLTTLAAIAVGVAWQLALLVGAILVVTGPTVIAPILRMLRPTRRVSSLLRWEGIVVDPIGAVLAVLVFQGVIAGGREGTAGDLAAALGITVALAVALALAVGYALELLIVRHVIPDHLQGVACLSAAIGALTVSNAVQAESGLLTVTLLGIYLGNRERLHLHHVQEFTEHLQVLLVGVLFVVLAGRVTPEQLGAVWWQALVFVVLLVIVVRPVSIVLGLWGTRVTSAEKRLLAGMAPRGIVAAAVASIFALEFAHVAHEAEENRAPRADELTRLATEAEALVPIVFVVIVCTVAFYGLGVGRLAERLGLATTSPQGVLFVGGKEWVVQAAQRLEELDVPCVVVDRVYADLGRARQAGLRTVVANILSDYAVRDLDLAGMGRLIATTSEDEVNATAAREFAQVLGRAHVFQVRRGDAPVGDAPASRRQVAASHLTARTPFDPPLTHDDLEARLAANWRVTRTKITTEFDLGRFRAEHGEDAVLLFAVRDGELEVVTEKSSLPDTGFVAVALVPPRQHGEESQ